MLSFKSLVFAFAALSVAGVEGSPCRTCVPTNIVQDSDFEGDASPWALTSGVEIRADTSDAALAHSPDHYVYVNIANRDDRTRYDISQQLSGLSVNQEYSLKYFWAVNYAGGIYDGGCEIATYLDGVQVDSTRFNGRPALNIWAEKEVLVTPASANPVLKLSMGCGGNYFYGAVLLLDDISMGKTCSTVRRS
ncbi:hypothetical protein BGZ61DRAFT_53404 [Ilyonectria robusta]|uniref:uncharacterized protein n=1 Tax=Ilyonectria robusta TaxID=1079257 RepID=UPI001E8E5A9A|nr:uncharacterized protein BGZ61DRAFT_53404 [Ilyonectria robusta]KAH8686539.1 hypothetical protein BGZ61DRAFT_53404 [Ilyonectria robusta]